MRDQRIKPGHPYSLQLPAGTVTPKYIKSNVIPIKSGTNKVDTCENLSTKRYIFENGLSNGENGGNGGEGDGKNLVEVDHSSFFSSSLLGTVTIGKVNVTIGKVTVTIVKVKVTIGKVKVTIWKVKVTI